MQGGIERMVTGSTRLFKRVRETSAHETESLVELDQILNGIFNLYVITKK